MHAQKFWYGNSANGALFQRRSSASQENLCRDEAGACLSVGVYINFPKEAGGMTKWFHISKQKGNRNL